MSCVTGALRWITSGNAGFPSSQGWASLKHENARYQITTYNLIDGHEPLYHGSLGLDEYRPLMAAQGFETVWRISSMILAIRRPYGRRECAGMLCLCPRPMSYRCSPRASP